MSEQGREAPETAAPRAAIRQVGVILDGGTILPGKREFIWFGGWEAVARDGRVCGHQHRTPRTAERCVGRLARG